MSSSTNMSVSSQASESGGSSCVPNASTSDQATPVAELPAAGLPETSTNLEITARLRSAATCVLCHNLARDTLLQCAGGHIICQRCLTYVAIQEKFCHNPTPCPTCGISLHISECSKNHVLMDLVKDLRDDCRYCHQSVFLRDMEQHLALSCKRKPVLCSWHLLGCEWEGLEEDLVRHMDSCIYANMRGEDLMTLLNEKDENDHEKLKLIGIQRLLSCWEFAIIDLTLKINTTLEVPKYQSKVFSIFSQNFMLIATPDFDIPSALGFDLIMQETIDEQMKFLFMVMVEENCELCSHVTACENNPFCELLVPTSYLQCSAAEYEALLLKDVFKVRLLLSYLKDEHLA